MFEVFLEVIAAEAAVGEVPAADAVDGHLLRFAAGAGFEHGDVETGFGEDVGGHAAGGAGADDADIVLSGHVSCAPGGGRGSPVAL